MEGRPGELRTSLAAGGSVRGGERPPHGQHAAARGFGSGHAGLSGSLPCVTPFVEIPTNERAVLPAAMVEEVSSWHTALSVALPDRPAGPQVSVRSAGSRVLLLTF